MVVDALCDWIAHSRTNMTCIGQSESVGSANPVLITGCTRASIMEMPHIKFQFDSYNFDVRPELYMDFVPIVEKNETKNETEPHNTTTNGTDWQLNTTGKYLGKIHIKQTTKNNRTY